MPLDSTNWKQETETKPDLSKPSLEGLSWLLRHLPADHQWDFQIVGGKTECGSAGCALGLANVVWPEYAGAKTMFPDVPEVVRHTFFHPHQYLLADRFVTPTMVADRIDAYLDETRK